MSNNNWYSPEDWYAPLHTEPEQKNSRGSKRPRLSFRWRLGIGITLVLGLIVLSSVVFSNSGSDVSVDFEYGFSEEMPEDFQDFFDSYYTDTEGISAAPNIEQVTERPDFELSFAKNEGEILSLQKLYEKCAKSTVSIKGFKDGEEGYYWGTGVVLSSDGLVLTNAHVIEGCDSVSVILYDDQSFEAKLVGADTTSDIAVLKIETTGLPAAEFGDSAELVVGQDVAAIGNPLGETFRMTLTNGIVSAIERGINYNGHSMNLIQTNTAINEGNSGGALYNMHGQVIGITNMKMMSSYSSIEGIGFAIPSATVKMVVNSLIEFGEVRGRPSIGITVGPVPEAAASHYDLPYGLYVSKVSEGSDAKAKGILEGDIILSANDVELETTDQLLQIKNSMIVGESITFSVWRNGEVFIVDVMLVDTNDIY